MSALINRVMSKLGGNSPVCFQVTFADGGSWQNRPGKPILRLHFKTRGAQWRALAFGHVGLLEAFFDQTLDVEGDFREAFRLGLHSRISARPNFPVRLRNRWHERVAGNGTYEQARRNARYHYGLGADFYAQWLDVPSMMYTCAYWSEGTRTIEEAQRNKMEHVCRKICLRPGERVVDIGCGFGGFMFHAHQRHAAQVCGVNTVPEQVDWLQGQIEAQGLSPALSVRLADFREVHDQFDKVVSIGVLEHAGRDQLEAVIKAHADFLKPGGLGMLHFIGHVGVRDTEFYIRKYVFPGGWIPSLSHAIAAMEANGLEILDVENLRRHYALTLDAWMERFERNWPDIRSIDPQRFDERFRRIWSTYLVSCAEMFRSPHSQTNLFQIVFSKGNVDSVNHPMTRRHVYEGESLVADHPLRAQRAPAET